MGHGQEQDQHGYGQPEHAFVGLAHAAQVVSAVGN